MQNANRWVQWSSGPFIAALAAFLFVGCQSSKEPSGSIAPARTAPTPGVAKPAPVVPPATPAPTAITAAPAQTPESTTARSPIRINAGTTAPYKDSNGNTWLPDQGFADGQTIERTGNLQIANTKDPALYRTERYSMSAFSYKLPNGKYTVKLHFAETFEDLTGPGQRVFSFNVAGHAFNDFDVCVKAGGPNRAYIETVPVDITNGKLDITFTSKVQNPEINGIEILPAP